MGRPRKFATMPVTRHGQVGIVGQKLACGTVFVGAEYVGPDLPGKAAKSTTNDTDGGASSAAADAGGELTFADSLAPPASAGPFSARALSPPVLDLADCLTALADCLADPAGFDLRPLVKNPLLRERIAQAIYEALADLRFHKCDSCGQWIAIGPGFCRESARHCNGACRQREYMKRQSLGMSPPTKAKQGAGT